MAKSKSEFTSKDPKTKKNSDVKRTRLWDGVTESDYINETNIEDKEMGAYNLEKMGIYALNATCSRHILDAMDSLKPVERRILYAMYLSKAYVVGNGGKKKSQGIVGETNKFHPHGGNTIYDTMVGMSQYWKRGIPLITVHGSKGDPTIKKYAAERYTEVTISPYAYECFFDSFDRSCVEMMQASNMEDEIPVSLPSKFPNILTNGGVGIAYGYSFAIPPYNPDDVIMATKRLLKDSEDQDFYIYPDLPTGCDIVDDGTELRKICEEGMGKLHMRGHIEIQEGKNTWILRITSVPWLTSPLDIKEDIANLQKQGIAQIEDVQDISDQYKLKDGTVITDVIIDVIIRKELDPYVIRDILYKNTNLDRTIAVQFRMVEDGLNVVQRNLYDSLNSWIDGRREYLRRLYNKKIRYTKARISILESFIELKDPKKIDKVIEVIRTHDEDEIVGYLVRKFGMNSYQADVVADQKLRAWSKSRMLSYEEELPERIKELDEYMKIVQSEKYIDEIISNDMDDLRKYSHPRRSTIILKEDGPKVADTEHLLVFTKKGLVKKLPVSPIGRNKGYGQFAAGDYPIHRIQISNMDSVILFDSTGRYSVIPVSTIPNSLHTDTGESVFSIAKLEGEIISVYPFYTPKNQRDLKKINSKGAFVFTLTKKGQMKKTPLAEFTSLRMIKNARAVRGKADEQLAMAEIMFDVGNILVYSKNGMASILATSDIPETGKDTVGNLVLNVTSDDECLGFCTVNGAKEILIVSERGAMKRVDCVEGTSFNALHPMKRRNTVYITSINNDDKVFRCLPIGEKDEKIFVCNRKDIHEYPIDAIPVLTRRASCPKLIPVPNGDNIITVIKV